MGLFNTARPMRPDEHYCIPPLSRLDQRKSLTLIPKQRYFVLHTPRQTGKTSALLALRNLLNGGDEGALPLRLRERRSGSGGPREPSGSHTPHSGRGGAAGEAPVGRRVAG